MSSPASPEGSTRIAGLAIPLFSLRSEQDSGIGELDDLVSFIDWAARRGQRLIALLPLGETSPGETSPYNALSSFALDPLYLRPGSIEELRDIELPARSTPPGAVVDHGRARTWKAPLLEEAFRRFRRLPDSHPRRERFAAFRESAGAWLSDYSLFRALAQAESGRSWTNWPAPLRDREPHALDQARRCFGERIGFFEYLQFAADEAWREVRRVAREHGVLLMGDLPFAPSENSADAWAHPDVFDLSRSAGAPPDEFSATGQRWGLPMYRWQSQRQGGWRWLRARARRMAELYDLFRVDHVVGLFRTFFFVGDEAGGFEPSAERDQIAQGREILAILAEEGHPAKLIAEDLGAVPAFVRETLHALDIPGYKILRWQREGERFADTAAYPECSVATTGTHDIDALVSWWASLKVPERRAVAALAGRPSAAPVPRLSRELRLALLDRLYHSPSRYVILPIQDLFGWKERINTPATTGGSNWIYRLPLPIERLDSDRKVAADADALAASIDASGRLRRMRERAERTMDEPKTGSVRANGLQFRYLEAGTGPLVLCLHGFPDHARSFRFQLPALARAGYRVVAPYLRGYAPTEVPPNGPYQSAALATDVAALVEALSPNEPAYVFGHDWGAIATYGAAQLAPNRIRKIATAAVPHGPQLLQAIVTSYAQMKRSWYIFMFQMPTAEGAVSQDDFSFLDKLWADWSPGWTIPAEEMAALKATFRQPGVLEAALAYYRHTFNPAFQRPELAELQASMLSAPVPVPGLVFHGERDGCIGVETLEGMEAGFPKGLKKVVVAGAGHFLHQEKPERINEELVAFFQP